MRETWGWCGQFDRITLSEIRETRVAGIVTTLHGIPSREVRPRDAIAARFAERIDVAHLRDGRKEAEGSFEEAAPLERDTGMMALVQVMIAPVRRRAVTIPWRPDHGHDLLDDLARG